MKESLKLLAFAVFWVAWGLIFAWCLGGCRERCRANADSDITEKRDTIFLTDTIVEIEPVPVSIVAKEIRNRKLPVAKPDTVFINMADSATPIDSIEIEVPITQVEYKDSLYHAWISGFEPRLDSIHLYLQNEIVTLEKTVTKYKNQHWHLGPTVGYGYTPKGFEPFIGVSLTYSIISF